MSVGGHIIDLAHVTHPDTGAPLTRYWVVDRGRDESVVHAERAEVEPCLGDEIWWQAGRIYFDGDRRSLRKVGDAGDPFFGADR